MRNFKLAIRNITNKKGNSLIKIISLGMGFAVALVLFAKVNFDLSYNSFYPDSERIYFITSYIEMLGDDTSKDYPQVSGAIAPGMKTEISEVEAATRFTYIASDATFYDETRNKYKGTFILADSCLFDILPRPMIVGNPKETLSKPMYVLIAKSIADKIGGDVMGKQIELDIHPGKLLTVGGVFEDIPENAQHRYDVIISMASISNFTWDGSNNWFGNDRYSGYVKLREGTKPASLANAMYQMQVKYQDIEKLKSEYNVFLTYNLNQLNDSFNNFPEVKRNVVLLTILGVALVFATVMNYILFVVSGLVDKAKSVAIRKTYGATRKNISRMMVAETFLHFIIAILLAVGMIFICKSIIEDIFSVSISALFSLQSIVILSVILLVIFIATTTGPSYMLTSIPVVAAFTTFRQTRRGWKLSLLFIQFVASSFLITLLVIVALQYEKMVTEDHGFDYEKLIYTQVRNEKNDVAIEKIKQLPFVQSVAKGSTLPASGSGVSGNNISLPEDGNKELFNIADLYYVDENFVPTMGIELVNGNNFSSQSTKDEMLVSRLFADKIVQLTGWTDGVIGKQVKVSEHGICKIVGIYKDMAVASVSSSGTDKPSAIFYNPDWTGSIVMKLENVDGEHIMQVQKIFNEIMPERDIEIIPYSTSFIKQYDTENRFKQSVMIVSIIILLTNMIGLIAYINNEIIRRSAEIAVRKINGATLRDILKLFVKNVLALIVPAFVLGSIAAYYAATKWMEAFIVKLSMNPLLFISCSLALALIILSIVVLNCIKTANQNPVDSLKSE